MKAHAAVGLGAVLLFAACESDELSESRSGVPASTQASDLSAAEGEQLCSWREETLEGEGLCRFLEAPDTLDEGECATRVAECVASSDERSCESATLRANLADCSPSVTVGRLEACDLQFAAWLGGLTCDTGSWTDPPSCREEIADLCQPPAPACSGNCSCMCTGGFVTGLLGGACTCSEACARAGAGSAVSGSCS
jgi:hypothetical protein